MTVICHDTSCIRRDISHACNVSNTVCRLICMFSKWMRDQCLTFSEQLFMQCTRTMSFVGYVVLAHRNCNLNEAMVDTLPWKQQSNWSHGRYIILTKFYNFWLNTEAKIYSVLVRGFWSTSKHVLLECLWPYKSKPDLHITLGANFVFLLKNLQFQYTVFKIRRHISDWGPGWLNEFGSWIT